MIFHETKLPGAYIINLTPFTDERGEFSRTWCSEEFAQHGLATSFVQANASLNPKPGTLRGLHYQLPPHTEAKLVRCVQGAVYDVIVDMRPDSPAYRQWIGVELTPKAKNMLYVPEGFAHGFQVLEKDTEVNYFVTAPYAKSAARGVRYDDPVFGIEWPLEVTSISEADKSWPLLDADTSTGREASAVQASERRVLEKEAAKQ